MNKVEFYMTTSVHTLDAGQKILRFDNMGDPVCAYLNVIIAI